MGDEWKIDMKIPDIGTMITLLATAVCSVVLSAAEIAYTMMWITSAYERNGKSFFIDLLNANSLTWTAEYVVVAGSLLLLSSMAFLICMTYALYELNGLAQNDEKKIHRKVLFGIFAVGLLLLFMALISAIILRYL